jgi:tight adherence protein B
MSTAIPLAFLAGACSAPAAVELLGGAARHAPLLAGGGARLLDVVVRLGREGRDPGAAERRRLLLAGAAIAFLTGAAILGPLAAVGLAAAGPWAIASILRARRGRYRRAVDGGAAEMAMAIADAVAGGHSLRAALAEASRSVAGPAGHELRRAAAELAAGARTEQALEAMRARVGSDRLETVLVACLLQRRVGGDLARLLRESARAMEEQARLDGELRAATAQARFTGVLVVVLPLGGALLAELASPGWLAGLWSSSLTAWLVGVAIALQAIAAMLIRRFGNPRS